MLIALPILALFAVGRRVGVARAIAQRRAGTAIVGAGVAIAIAAAYVRTKVGG